jgi:hypothetical protein
LQALAVKAGLYEGEREKEGWLRLKGKAKKALSDQRYVPLKETAVCGG